MEEPLVITTDGLDYTWSPSKSTPSAKVPIAELPEIARLLRNRGASRVVDFGAGRGRNARILSNTFEELLLVEEHRNLAHLRQVASDIDGQALTVQSWDEYRRSNTPRVDAVLMCFVIHTLPTAAIRREVIATNVARLRRSGAIVFVTPRNDSKYRPDLLTDAVYFEDGIVRLYRGQMAFSFYRNYTREEFVRLIEEAGLRIEATIPSDRRMIFLTSCQE